MIKSAVTLKKEPEELQSKEYKLNWQVINDKLSYQIEDLLQELGVDLSDYQCDASFIKGCAPCHGGDNPTGFTYYRDKGTWWCWTHECSANYGIGTIGLIRAILGVEHEEALKYAEKFLHGHKIDSRKLEEAKKVREKLRKNVSKIYWKDHKNPYRIFSENLLQSLNSAEEFARQRGLCPDTFKKYGIGYAWKGPLKGRIIVPIRNVSSDIVGFSGRILNEESNPNKWYHWPTDTKGKLRTSIHLFNIDRAFKFNIQNGQSHYILVEGPFDVIKMEMAGVHNAICTFGNNISNGQVEILVQIGATKIIIAYDGDEPGNEGADRAAKKLKRKLFDSNIIRLTDMFPVWNEDKLGGLDWANPNIHITLIKDLMEKFYDNWNSWAKAIR